ncbi:hypothetical protein RUM43_008750 [Polyplax serrata]|uniref:Secreted protein n=1 Tax=Polyplax serrata TaxID=468196 RepID=A0AAN8P6C9_POLSC
MRLAARVSLLLLLYCWPKKRIAYQPGETSSFKSKNAVKSFLTRYSFGVPEFPGFQLLSCCLRTAGYSLPFCFYCSSCEITGEQERSQDFLHLAPAGGDVVAQLRAQATSGLSLSLFLPLRPATYPGGVNQPRLRDIIPPRQQFYKTCIHHPEFNGPKNVKAIN